MKLYKAMVSLVFLGAILTSCENADWDFPGTDFSTVSFSKQSPVRTLTLGDDVYDTSLDNAHKCQIMAVWGGGYSPQSNVTVNVAVDNTLCDGLNFADGTPVTPMPSSYYTLASDHLVIPAGRVLGGVEVQFTDDFFNDPKSITTHYVIPVRITGVHGADSVLNGKDYTLYAVKYINKYHGNWLCSGTDVIDENGTVTTVERTAENVEDYDVCTLSTTEYRQVAYTVSTVVKVQNATGDLVNKELNAELLLTFDDSDHCTITTQTEGCTATGTGTWTRQGAKKAWGDKDRDLLELSYELTYTYRQTDGGQLLTKKYKSEDRLIMRDRGSKLEEFTPVGK